MMNRDWESESLIVPYGGEGDGHRLGYAPWPEYPYLPEVTFAIGWTGEEILLRYEVREESVRAELGRINDMVCKDSCVEFFIDPGDGSYFNIEVNPIGTVYAAHGYSREDSRPLPPEQVARIRCRGTLGREPFPERRGPETWSIRVAVPLSLFAGYDLAAPGGKTFRGNFYKCGDLLSRPHYAVWSRIGTEAPDFHRPEYFGEIRFEERP